LQKTEQPVAMVTAHGSSERNGALLVTIPMAVRAATGATRGSRYVVKIDNAHRIIYEPLSDSSPRSEKKSLGVEQ
jgi:hypothetical protein